MDVDSFLRIEKCRLIQEYQRLQCYNKIQNSTDSTNNSSENNNLVKHDTNSQDKSNGQIHEESEKYYNGNDFKKDEMEQWVTNTFYSYFPGYNDEYRRRHFKEHCSVENISTMEHQKMNKNRSKNSKINKEVVENDSSTSLPSSSSLSIGLACKSSTTRAGTSARCKLLQDLRHTDLKTLMNSNEEDIAKLERQKHEMAQAKKREYQLNLLQQIEEKRQLIHALKKQEEKEEKMLTKRLEAQLKMMKLEEEKEKKRKRKKPDATDEIKKNQKAYKFFTNYPKSNLNHLNKSYSESLSEVEVYDVTSSKTEKQCFHLSEKICPMCNGPLKEFHNFCLHCQKKLLLAIKEPPPVTHETSTEDKSNMDSKETNNITKVDDQDIKNDLDHMKDEKDFKNYENGNIQSCSDYSLVCCNCYRFYTYCSTCSSSTGDLCRACRRKRNVCEQCRRDLCSFCLEEIACGRDVEQCHINEFDKDTNVPKSNNEISSVRLICGLGEGKLNQSFHMNEFENDSITSLNATKVETELKAKEDKQEEKDSIQALNIFDKPANTNDETITESSRRNIEKRLESFFENYGDLLHLNENNNSVIPTKEAIKKRKYSLSSPLLREMPKLSRHNINELQSHT